MLQLLTKKNATVSIDPVASFCSRFRWAPHGGAQQDFSESVLRRLSVTPARWVLMPMRPQSRAALPYGHAT
jgi:hypothetical protein